MKRIEPRKTCVFIGLLAVIAWSINSYVGKSSHSFFPKILPRPSRSDVSERAVIEAARSRAQFVAKYVNTRVERTTGVNFVAIVVASENGRIERNLSEALASYLKSPGVKIVGSFFKPQFVSDGLLNELFTDPTRLMEKLELDKSLDGFVLARQSVVYSTNPGLENVITASMSLGILVQATDASRASQQWTLAANGAGFSRNAARLMAEERILKQINTDGKVSLKVVIAPKQNQSL